jgi:hypothetical protein
LPTCLSGLAHRCPLRPALRAPDYSVRWPSQARINRL